MQSPLHIDTVLRVIIVLTNPGRYYADRGNCTQLVSIGDIRGTQCEVKRAGSVRTVCGIRVT